MHDFFLKSKFNILSSPLFNNFYKRNNEDEYFKKDRNNNDDLGVMHNYADDSEWREHNKKDRMTSLKNELNEQLIYTYYNNFNNNYEYYNKSTEKLKEKNNEDEYNEEQEYEPTANLLQDKNKINDMNNFYNNFNKNSLFNYQNFQNADKNFLYLLNKKNKNNSTNENILVDEFKKLKNHVLFLQMMNVNLQKQLLTNHLINTPKIMPHHIIINNKTEVSSNAVSEIQNNKDKKKNGTMYILLKKILSSRFNQMIFVSSIFISFYLINKHWQRALKISQLQKK